MKKLNSQTLYNKALDVMVGGVNSPVRSFKSVNMDPLIMKYGRKAQLFDVDNNVYTDYCLSWGALIAGHAHRNVVLAAKKTIEDGSSFGATTKAEIEIAEFIVSQVPSIDKIRFVNSGTEATMSAIRLARGFTGREIVVKFDGCYHGHVDDLLTTAGSGVAQLQESSSAGIPNSHIANTLSLPYNDIDTFMKKIEEHHENIACVIIEPVAGNMGVIKATKEFLKIVRELTEKFNIVLIFDEIMSGFRNSVGCTQGETGITPDITCLGKIIGGGFPIGAYGGRKEIMDSLAPLGDVYQAGTFSGNPVVMRAGLAQLKLLGPEFYKTLNEKCAAFVNNLNKFFKENNVDVHISSNGSMMSLRFRTSEVNNYADAQEASGGQRYTNLFHHLLSHGIYWPPADLEAFFISAMHTEKDLDHLSEVLKEFFLNEKNDNERMQTCTDSIKAS